MTDVELRAFALQSQKDKLAAEDKLTKTQAGAAKEIKALKEKIKETKETATGKVFVTHEDKKYLVTSPAFSLPNSLTGGKNTSIKAEELKDKPELIQKLIALESGILLEVVKE